MSTSDKIQLAILIVYSIQLIVLILGYFGIIKETSRNARERQKAIDDAGNKLQEVVTNTTEQLTRKANQQKYALIAISLLTFFNIFLNAISRFKEPKA